MTRPAGPHESVGTRGRTERARLDERRTAAVLEFLLDLRDEDARLGGDAWASLAEAVARFEHRLDRERATVADRAPHPVEHHPRRATTWPLPEVPSPWGDRVVA